MSTRSVLGLVYTLEGLKAYGVTIEPVLKTYGMSLENISPEAEIERALELQIYNDLSQYIEDPLTGLRIGNKMSLVGYGQLIMLIMSCQNAFEAFKEGIRYQNLTYSFGKASLNTKSQETEFILDPVPLPESCRRFLIDRDISGAHQFIKDVQHNIGENIDPIRIEIPYPKPPEHEAYQAHFNCPVIFGADNLKAIIHTKDLSIAFPSANQTAYALYKKQCDQMLTQREINQDALADSIRSYLALFNEKLPSAEDTSATFGLSERSLRRKLSQESTSFRKLVDEVRSTKAKELLLNTQLTIESIAQSLGYAESAAFVHAFRRWENTTPAQYRSSHKQ